MFCRHLCTLSWYTYAHVTVWQRCCSLRLARYRWLQDGAVTSQVSSVERLAVRVSRKLLGLQESDVADLVLCIVSLVYLDPLSSPLSLQEPI